MAQTWQPGNRIHRICYETQWKALLHAQNCLIDLFDRPDPLIQGHAGTTSLLLNLYVSMGANHHLCKWVYGH